MYTIWQVLVLMVYLAINLLTAMLYDARQMRRMFIRKQCFVGKVFANLFYAPAWFLKLLRYAVVTTIK